MLFSCNSAAARTYFLLNYINNSYNRLHTVAKQQYVQAPRGASSRHAFSQQCAWMSEYYNNEQIKTMGGALYTISRTEIHDV